MLKNESARNATKPMPLCPSHLPDSGGIFTLSNGLRMEKISRSVRKVKQAKKIVDYAVRTVCTDDDVACPYSDTWQVHTATCGRSIQRHVAAPGSDTWHAFLVDLAYGWTNPEVTRVTTERVTLARVMSPGDMAG
jgi:hypothetical protein